MYTSFIPSATGSRSLMPNFLSVTLTSGTTSQPEEEDIGVSLTTEEKQQDTRALQFKHIKGQLHWFSTLSLSIRRDRDIMWRPTIFFFIVLCVSGMQLQNLLWCHYFQEELQTVNPSPFPSHSRWASAVFVLSGFSGPGCLKTPHYWKLRNIK